MAQLLQLGVNTAYKRYIAFLEQGKNVGNESIKIRSLIRHASYWKGGTSAPTKTYILDVLRLRGQDATATDTKFELYQKLVMHLRQSVRGMTGYVEPIPQTSVAKLLFEEPRSNVITGPAQELRNNPPPVVGTRRFQTADEFNKFMILGQHPTNSSPCVPAAKVVWSHPMVYEEWHLHRVTTSGTGGCCEVYLKK